MAHKQDEQAIFEHQIKKAREEEFQGAKKLKDKGEMEEAVAVFSYKGMDLLFSIVRDIVREEAHEFYANLIEGLETGYKRYRQGQYVQTPELKSLIREVIREELNQSLDTENKEQHVGTSPKTTPSEDLKQKKREAKKETTTKKRKPRSKQVPTRRIYEESLVIEELLKRKGAMKLAKIQQEVDFSMGINPTARMNRVMKANPKIQRIGGGRYKLK